MHSAICQCCKSMPKHVYCSSACALRWQCELCLCFALAMRALPVLLRWQCEPASPCKPDGEALLRAAAISRNLPNRVGSPCSARKRVRRLVCAGSTSAPRAALARQRKRGPRSEAWHTSVWLRFGVATLARRRALCERMPCSLFSTLSGRDSRAAAQIKLSLSRSHYQRAAGAEKS